MGEPTRDRIPENAVEFTGDENLAKRIFADTLDAMSADEYDLLRPMHERSVFTEPRGVFTAQSLSRSWLRKRSKQNVPYYRLSPLLDSAATADVYRAFADLYDDPAEVIVSVGGFGEAVDIVFAASRFRFGFPMDRKSFIRLEVLARRDGEDVLDWLLRLCLELETRRVSVDFVPDIEYIHKNMGLPFDFVVESICSCGGVSNAMMTDAFNGLESIGWGNLSEGFGLRSRGRGNGLSATVLDHPTRRLSLEMMRALAEMPSDFAAVDSALGFTARLPHAGFRYLTKVMGRDGRATISESLKFLQSVVVPDDPQVLYRFMVFLVEEGVCVDAFHYAVFFDSSAPGYGVPRSKIVSDAYGGWKMSMPALRSFFVGNPEDISGIGPHHANRRPPAEALEYIRHGTWPETLTYGHDVFIIPEPIRRAFADLTPDRYEDAVSEYSDASGEHNLRNGVITHPDVRPLVE